MLIYYIPFKWYLFLQKPVYKPHPYYGVKNVTYNGDFMVNKMIKIHVKIQSLLNGNMDNSLYCLL